MYCSKIHQQVLVNIEFIFLLLSAAATLILTVYSQDERDVFKYSQQFQVIDVNFKNATLISRELLGNMHFEGEISHRDCLWLYNEKYVIGYPELQVIWINC